MRCFLSERLSAGISLPKAGVFFGIDGAAPCPSQLAPVGRRGKLGMGDPDPGAAMRSELVGPKHSEMK